MSNSATRQPVPAIRVLLSRMPGLLAAVITTAIQKQPDMRLVGLAKSNAELIAAAPGCDVVILAGSQLDVPPDIIHYLFSEFPYLRIIIVATNADSAALYWLGLRRDWVQHLAAESVPDTIRHVYSLSSRS